MRLICSATSCGGYVHFRNVAHQTIETIISMSCVHVLEALNEGQLKSNGTLQEQKKRLVEYELRKWLERVKESYTPPGEAATTSFNAAIDSEVQSLRAYYEARAVSMPAPSSANGAGTGGLEVLSGSANDIANSLRREPVARPAGDRPFLRAGEQVFYWHPLFTAGEKRARRHTTITAIRDLGSAGGDSSGGVRVKLPEDGPVRYMEVCFADGASIDKDHGVQRTHNIDGAQLKPTRPIIPLEHYRLVPSVIPPPDPDSTQVRIIARLLPDPVLDCGATKEAEMHRGVTKDAEMHGGATKDDTGTPDVHGSSHHAQGPQSVKLLPSKRTQTPGATCTKRTNQQTPED